MTVSDNTDIYTRDLYAEEDIDGADNVCVSEAPSQHIENEDIDTQSGGVDPQRWLEVPSIAFREWKESQRVNHKEFAPHSVNQYQTMFGAYLRWLSEKGVAMEKARPEHLDLFLASKAGRNGKAAAPSTRRRYLHLLNDVYEHLRLLELRKDNPAAPLIDLTRNQDFEKPAPCILSIELANRYIQWCKDQPAKQWFEIRNAALRLAFICSGIQVCELQALKPKNLIFDGQTMAFEVEAHGFVVARLAPVSKIAHDALLNWQSCLQDIAPDSEHLFPARMFTNGHDHPDKTAVASAEAFLIVQEAMVGIGYDRSRQGPQTLRNTFIARQIWDGKPVDRIMAWTGLRTSESVNKIAKLVPVRKDGIGPT